MLGSANRYLHELSHSFAIPLAPTSFATVSVVDTLRLAWSRPSSMKYGTLHERQRESSYPPPENAGHTRSSRQAASASDERAGADFGGEGNASLNQVSCFRLTIRLRESMALSLFFDDTDGCRQSNSLQRGQALIRRTGIDEMRRRKRRLVPPRFAGVGTMTLCSEYADFVSRPASTGAKSSQS